MSDTSTTAAIRLLLASADEATATGQHDLSRELMAAVEKLRGGPLLIDRYRALTKTADAMRRATTNAVGWTAAYEAYDAARAAVREIEEATSSTTAKTPPER